MTFINDIMKQSRFLKTIPHSDSSSNNKLCIAAGVSLLPTVRIGTGSIQLLKSTIQLQFQKQNQRF